MKPLFLPVTSEVFGWYERYNKHYEIRPIGNFNEKTVTVNRDIWVSKGYNGKRFLASVSSVVVGSIDEILKKVPWDEIIPIAKSLKEAQQKILSMIKSKKYIVFEIDPYFV